MPQDPQIELQENDGTVRGHVYYDSDGNVVLRNAENGNEAKLKSDGTFEVDSLTAISEFTDPSGNTYTGGVGKSEEQIEDIIGNALGRGLSYDDPEGIIYETATGPNPYEAAQTLVESGLAVSTDGASVSDGSVQLTPLEFPDDFEDGLDAGWSGDTANLSAQSSTNLIGGQSAEFVSDNGNTVMSPSVGAAQSNVVIYWTSQDSVGWNWEFYDDSGTQFGRILGGGGFTWEGASYTDFASNQTGVEYRMELAFDWSANEVVIDINGDQYGPFQFITGASNWDQIGVTGPNTSGDTVFFDGREASLTGTATIEWDTGVPTDIYEWDVATYTASLDGETVDVYVAHDDGTGWTRANGGDPISRNFSLVDDPSISPSDNVRIEAELSRSDTSNNPTLDSAYRSWMV